MKSERLLIPLLLLTLIRAALSGTDPSQDLMNLDMTESGAYESVTRLLDSGASSNAYTRDGDRAIFHAVKSGNRDIVNLLLERGADPNVSFNDAAGSPLDSAVSAGDPEIVLLLIKNRAAADYKMRGAHTALHTACMQKESQQVSAIITILLQNGADVNAVTHLGVTPLMNAVEADNTAAVKILLQHGADPRIRNIKGETALDLAVNGGKNGEIITLLKSWKKKGK
ncbi:MAG TPA: ankyrin repeat domain-containing protein [Spirochaetota bacterium]|nr:ankyrin repeat domain-containing protein [Spirochaetota bacterium]